MDDIRIRIRQAMEWLKDNRLFASNRAIAERMGYNPSALSQVITGKANVSERFVKCLCGICPALRYEWIWKGEGVMIAENPSGRQETENPIPQMDRFSYILGSMAEIIKSITELTGPLAGVSSVWRERSRNKHARLRRCAPCCLKTQKPPLPERNDGRFPYIMDYFSLSKPWMTLV